MCHDLLPVTTKLLTCHVDVSITCPVCNGAPKTILHILCHYPIAWQVRSLNAYFTCDLVHSIDDWLVSIPNSCQLDVISCIFILLWREWWNCNNVI